MDIINHPQLLLVKDSYHDTHSLVLSPRGFIQTTISELRTEANNGNPEAQCVLGNYYDKGINVNQDYCKAVDWYRKSAEQGYPVAQVLLAFLYLQGFGVPKDYTLYVEWLR